MKRVLEDYWRLLKTIGREQGGAIGGTIGREQEENREDYWRTIGKISKVTKIQNAVCGVCE